LSSQAMALLSMREVLRKERKRQLRALRARMVAAGADSSEVSAVKHVIELLPAPRGFSSYRESKHHDDDDGDDDYDDDDDEKTPELPPRKGTVRTARMGRTGHRRPKSWTRSDFVSLHVRAVSDEGFKGGGRGSGGGDDVSISGYLLKRRAFIGGWARRYFVVVYPHLLYYVNAEDHASGLEARGIFDLSRCTVGKGNGMFDIVLNHEDLNKRWILQGSSKDELEKWSNAFRT